MDEERELDETEKQELDMLAEEWLQLSSEQERRAWREQSDREEGRDYGDEDEDFGARRRAVDRVRSVKEDAVLRALEDRIHELGARLARPYEHWNEDERYMEWSERDRGDE